MGTDPFTRGKNSMSGNDAWMKKALFNITFVAIAFFFLSGCGQSSNQNGNSSKGFHQPDTDVTSLPQYNFASFAGTIWKTKVKVALADATLSTNKHNLGLLVPKHFDPSHPEYTAPHDTQIIAILPVGTHLRIEHLMKDNGVWGGVWPTATLLDGTNAQKSLVLDNMLLAKNRFIWPGWSSSTNWGVNPDMLEN